MRYVLLIAAVAAPMMAAGPGAMFSEHTIASDLRGGYHLMTADLNHDGKPDLIALGSGMSELVWYENPTWERHVIAGGFSHMINCTVIGDEIVVASGFGMEAKNSAGIVSVLRPKGDPREAWSVQEIDRLPTSHRLRTADIDGSGKRVVINAPLNGPQATAPDYRDHTPLVFYRPGEWKRELISDENTGVVHGIYILDWDGDGRDEILTASFTGIHLFKLGKNGAWTRTEIAKGDPAPWPKSGSSDIAVGRIGKARFLAAIEPWHGNEVVIYRQHGDAWARQVIDSSFVEGHTIQTADFDGDGTDEVVAGYRGAHGGVYIYRANGEGWTRQPLDEGGMAANTCVVADFNGDGRPDIACIGGNKLKWYENK